MGSLNKEILATNNGRSSPWTEQLKRYGSLRFLNCQAKRRLLGSMVRPDHGLKDDPQGTDFKQEVNGSGPTVWRFNLNQWRLIWAVKVFS